MTGAAKKNPPLFDEPPRRAARTYFERKWRERGFNLIAGVDEAGRGPLAGPVVAAAVIMPENIGPRSRLWKIRDSKVLRPEQRDELFLLIKERAIDSAVGMCSPEEIDELNILQASLQAMRRAVYALKTRPNLCLVDGRDFLECDIPCHSICKGDGHCFSISAASIIAKVTRDRIMDKYHQSYPVYNFINNKGYGCKIHRQAIREHGPCPIHRKTFKGVKEYI
jgi:ribonuclease HII